jgi:hypothetical protein
MASERARERAGKKTKTHMSDKQLTDFMVKNMESGKHHGMKRKGKH